MTTHREQAVAALAEALHVTDIANVVFVGDEDDHPADASALVAYLDANPAEKAALAAWACDRPHATMRPGGFGYAIDGPSSWHEPTPDTAPVATEEVAAPSDAPEKEADE